MTKEEFVEQYARESGMPVEEILTLLIPEPCTKSCDYEQCRGWKMTPKGVARISEDLNVIDLFGLASNHQ